MRSVPLTSLRSSSLGSLLPCTLLVSFILHAVRSSKVFDVPGSLLHRVVLLDAPSLERLLMFFKELSGITSAVLPYTFSM